MLVKAQPFSVVKVLFVKLKRLGKELRCTAALSTILLCLVCSFVAQTTHALDEFESVNARKCER